MPEINDKQKRGIQDVYAGASAFNANNAQIGKSIQALNTMFLGVVTAVKTSGAGGSLTVSAQPLIATLDANGDAQPAVSYVELPYQRIQAGVAGLICDPVVGDIGVFVCAKRDISGIRHGASAAQVPASWRQFDLADAVMVATIHTGAPTTYIHLMQDGTIAIKAPQALNVTAPKTTVTGDVEITGDVKVTGNLTITGSTSTGGINLNSHVHGGVESGGSTTAGPQ